MRVLGIKLDQTIPLGQLLTFLAIPQFFIGHNGTVEPREVSKPSILTRFHLNPGIGGSGRYLAAQYAGARHETRPNNSPGVTFDILSDSLIFYRT